MLPSSSHPYMSTTERIVTPPLHHTDTHNEGACSILPIFLNVVVVGCYEVYGNAVRRLSVAVIGALLVLQFVGSPGADASVTCTDSGHCYAEERTGPTSGGSGFLGANGYIHGACLYNSSQTTHFTTAETWLGFTQTGNYWIEAGLAVGYPGSGKYFFCADNRPGHGYSEHDDPTDYPDNVHYYYFDIDSLGGGNFDVLIGPYSGESTGWSASALANTITTGSETNGGASAAYGLSSQLGYYTTANALHSGWNWGGGTPYPIRQPSSWGFVSTVSANTWYSYGTQTTSC